MSSYLIVAFASCRAVGIARSPQDGVLAEALLDAEDGFLHAALLLALSLLGFLLLCQSLIVGEEVELERSVPRRLRLFRPGLFFPCSFVKNRKIMLAIL